MSISTCTRCCRPSRRSRPGSPVQFAAHPHASNYLRRSYLARHTWCHLRSWPAGMQHLTSATVVERCCPNAAVSCSSGSSRHVPQQRVALPQQFTNLRNFIPACSPPATRQQHAAGEVLGYLIIQHNLHIFPCCDEMLWSGCRVYALDAAMSFDYEAKANARLKQQTALRIGIVGFGTFGQFLAKRLIQQGHKVRSSVLELHSSLTDCCNSVIAMHAHTCSDATRCMPV